MQDARVNRIGRLCTVASVRCAAALFLGVLPALPILLPRAPFEFRQTYTFSSMPADDGSLEAWVRAQTNVVDGEAVRSAGGQVAVRFVRRGIGAEALYPPMRELGYEGMAGGRFSSSLDYTMLFGDPFFALVFLLSSQFGFLAVGLWWFRRERRRGRPLGDVFDLPALRPVGRGLLLGGVLAAMGLAYDVVLRWIPVELPDTAGVWCGAAELSTGPLAVVLAFGCVIAPICEELFFRGAVFGSFRAAGHPAAGVVFSAVLFAFVHLDPVNIIPLLIFGLLNAWAIHRTRSLILVIVAHAVNNTVAFGLILW